MDLTLPDNIKDDIEKAIQTDEEYIAAKEAFDAAKEKLRAQNKWGTDLDKFFCRLLTDYFKQHFPGISYVSCSVLAVSKNKHYKLRLMIHGIVYGGNQFHIYNRSYRHAVNGWLTRHNVIGIKDSDFPPFQSYDFMDHYKTLKREFQASIVNREWGWV